MCEEYIENSMPCTVFLFALVFLRLVRGQNPLVPGLMIVNWLLNPSAADLHALSRHYHFQIFSSAAATCSPALQKDVCTHP